MRYCQIAVALTLVGIFLFVAAAFATSGYGVIGVVFLGPLLIALVAGPFAIAALVKRDGPLWCAVAALIVSFGPLLFLVGAYVAKQADDAAYQNRAAGSSGTTDVAPALDPPIGPRVDANGDPLPRPPPASSPDPTPEAEPPLPPGVKPLTPGAELFPPPVVPDRR